MWYFISAFASALITFILYHLIIGRKHKKQMQQILSQIISFRKLQAGPVSVNESSIESNISSELLLLENEHEAQIEKLKNTESYRKEFLGNISHELRTPIFAAQGFIHTLIDGGIDDPDVNMVYLSKAGKALDRLISMVDDLESISKLESGDFALEMRTFDICELIRDTVESLELMASAKKIKLIAAFDLTQHHYTIADKERIRQVVTNLLVNSIKYGKEGGNTTIKITESDEKIFVEVKDNGIGIDKQHLPRLFERFYRVDKHRSRSEGGTGLGLAIVKHIIEAHGERIQVESNIGKGTAFTFSLKKSV